MQACVHAHSEESKLMLLGILIPPAANGLTHMHSLFISCAADLRLGTVAVHRQEQHGRHALEVSRQQACGMLA